jgi:hypothetical protein
MDAATIALFELANISALIVDTDEDTTLSVAQVAAAYGVSIPLQNPFLFPFYFSFLPHFQAPVISLSSITEVFTKKTNTPTMVRMSASNYHQVCCPPLPYTLTILCFIHVFIHFLSRLLLLSKLLQIYKRTRRY